MIACASRLGAASAKVFPSGKMRPVCTAANKSPYNAAGLCWAPKGAAISASAAIDVATETP